VPNIRNINKPTILAGKPNGKEVKMFSNNNLILNTAHQ
jgi:hypothetical protein